MNRTTLSVESLETRESPASLSRAQLLMLSQNQQRIREIQQQVTMNRLMIADRNFNMFQSYIRG